MIKLTEQQKGDLRKHGVMSVYLFGSHAQDAATKKSDIDFAILMSDPQIVQRHKNTLPLYQQLYRILSEVHPNADVVDIVFLQSGVSLELQANVVRNGKLLLDDEPLKKAAYEEQVMMRAADFAPILRMIDNAILERI